MLLNTFLGLIANLALVSYDCNIVTSEVTSIDWNQFTGPDPWYAGLARYNDLVTLLECPKATFTNVVGNTAIVNATAFLRSLPVPFVVVATAIYQEPSSYFTVVTIPPIWSGRFYVISVHYNLYVIIKVCAIFPPQTSVYVFFRSPEPDDPTINAALTDMRKNNIDDSQFVPLPAYHCL